MAAPLPDSWVHRDLPGSWTTPVRRAVLSDPGGPRRPRHMTAGAVLPSGSTTPSATAISWISRLYHTAHLLAVYASQRRSPDVHARLAPGPLAELWPDGICTRWVVFTIFKSAHRGLLVFVPSFAWRNVDTIVVNGCLECEVLPAPACQRSTAAAKRGNNRAPRRPAVRISPRRAKRSRLHLK